MIAERLQKERSYMGRIIIFTGKGGVGKTSVAAAHGKAAAGMGKKTLIVSTDMAHNLSDLFERPLGKEETMIQKDLYALELDPEYIMENDFSDMMRAFDNLLTGKKEKDAEAPVIFPGMEELFSLLKIQEIYERGEYDLIIVDCAPTGETLSLLKFPELLSWYMEKFFPVGKLGMRLLAPVSRQLFKVQLPDRAAMNDIEKLYARLLDLQELLKNKEISSVRLVTVPEKMIVEETKRNYMYMSLYNFNVDGVYINRILPEAIGNGFFEEWLAIQKEYITRIEEIFGNIPVSRIPWYDTDICGMDTLDRICQDALHAEDLFEVKQITPNETYEKNEKGYLLRIFLPGAAKEEVNMHQTGTDIILKIGNFKRNIPIPGILRTYGVTSAKMEEGLLAVQFEKEVQEG